MRGERGELPVERFQGLFVSQQARPLTEDMLWRAVAGLVPEKEIDMDANELLHIFVATVEALAKLRAEQTAELMDSNVPQVNYAGTFRDIEREYGTELPPELKQYVLLHLM